MSYKVRDEFGPLLNLIIETTIETSNLDYYKINKIAKINTKKN